MSVVGKDIDNSMQDRINTDRECYKELIEITSIPWSSKEFNHFRYAQCIHRLYKNMKEVWFHESSEVSSVFLDKAREQQMKNKEQSKIEAVFQLDVLHDKDMLIPNLMNLDFNFKFNNNETFVKRAVMTSTVLK